MPKKKSKLARARTTPRVVTALLAVLVIGVVTVAGIASRGDSRAAQRDFIYRDGMKLMLNGQQYKFAGLNADKWFGCWGANEVPSDAQLDAYFKAMNPHSMTRIWPYVNTNWRTLLPKVVAAAEKYDQYLMVTLSDGNSGGQQCGSGGINTYGDPSKIIAHINNVVPSYKNSKAIGIWEVINEGSHSASSASWYRAATDAIKKADPNHLITSGAGTCYDTNWNNCVAVNDLPNNDLVNFHEYDSEQPSNWTDEHVNIARKVGKPFFVGETGFCCNGGNTGSDAGNAAKMKKEFDVYLAMPENAGVTYWALDYNHPTVNEIEPGDAMWNKLINYRHAYQATGTGTVPTNAPTATPVGATPTPVVPTPTPTPAGTGSVNDSNFSYSGTWGTSTSTATYNNDDHYSRTADSSYSLSFTGTAVSLFASKASHHGIAGVSIDGGAETNVDLYSPTRADQEQVFTRTGLSNGTHTIRVRVTGQKNAASTDLVVNADRIDVTNPSGGTPNPTATPAATPTPGTGLKGDLNGDGKVGALDLSVMLSNWGKAGGDLNGDGTTGILDLSIMISNWGK